MRPVRLARPRGFTVLELLVSLGIGLVLLAGALGAGLALQRTARFEEELSSVQSALRAASDAVSADVKRAGAGMGSARITLGRSADGVEQLRYAVEVQPAATFSDADFARPVAPYAAQVSDALLLRGGVPDGLLALANCTGDPEVHSTRTAAGTEVCLEAAAPADLLGEDVLFVHPALAVACAARATGPASATPTGVVTLATGLRDALADVEAPSPCSTTGGRFWGLTRTLLMREQTWGYRVSWRDAGTRPVLQAFSPADGGWVDVVQGVERMTVRLGVARPGTAEPLRWFPDASATPARPALGASACEPSSTCDAWVAEVGGYRDTNPSGAAPERTDLPATHPARARDALLRRVQAVEVTLVVRSQRVDLERVVRTEAGFALDAEGFPRDGYRRRRTTFVIAPRNLVVAGLGDL